MIDAALWAASDTGLLFHGGRGGWTMLLVFLVCAGLTLAFYRKAFQYLGTRPLLILVLLRMTAIFLLLILLFRPGFKFQRISEDITHLAVVLDTSQSMTIADSASGTTRLQEACDQLKGSLDLVADRFELHGFSFDSAVREVELPGDLEALEAKGESTQIRKAIRFIGSKLRRAKKNLGGIILMSDGLDNSNRNPVKEAKKLGIPIHVLATGSNLRENPSFKDVAIESVEADERLTVNDETIVTAHVEALGLASSVVEVVLREKDKVLTKQELTLDDRPGSQPVKLSFTPTEKGRFDYSVSIEPQAGERITVNNKQDFSALVADAKIRVLYLEGTIRAEDKPLIGQFLAKDPHIEYASMVLITRQRFQFRTNVKGLKKPKSIFRTEEELKRFDVFMLGDIDAGNLKAQTPVIDKLVAEGKGLVMMGGSNSFGPGGYGASPLAKALPVECGPRSTGQEDSKFLPRLTPEGFDHPILHKITEFFPFGKNPPKRPGLPPLLGCTVVPGTKPGATVLAVHPVRKSAAGAMPVLVVQTYGKGRSVAFAGDTTWRWYQTMKGLGQESPYLKFWGQIVRWAAKREDQAMETTAGVTAEIAKSYYKPDEDVTIHANVRQAEGQGTNSAVTRAIIQGPKGKPHETQLTSVPGPAGWYEGRFEPPASGAYQVTVTATLEGKELGKAEFGFQVGRPSLEFDRLTLNATLLNNLSDATRGRYLHVSRTNDLFEALESDRRQSVGYEEIDLKDQSRWPLQVFLWILILGVLTAEWLCRKRWRLH